MRKKFNSFHNFKIEMHMNFCNHSEKAISEYTKKVFINALLFLKKLVILWNFSSLSICAFAEYHCLEMHVALVGHDNRDHRYYYILESVWKKKLIYLLLFSVGLSKIYIICMYLCLWVWYKNPKMHMNMNFFFRYRHQ